MAETPVKETPAEEAVKAEEAPVEEAPVEEASEKSGGKKKGVLLLLLLLAVGIGVGVYFAFFREKPDDGRIPYAEGAVLFGDEDVEPVEKDWMKLTYNYQAKSSDGVIFTCLLTNDPANVYDMYFDIYADNRMTDQVFLSGLIRPGYGLKEIVLNHALPAGTTTCYVVFNQVDTDEDGNQAIVNQMVVTVDFIVQ